MTRHLLLVTILGLAPTGCGISPELYDARGDELKKAIADLDASKKACADHKKKADDEIGQLKKDKEGLTDRLKMLGDDINKSQADLEEAKKRMAELQKAQEQAELRNKQYRDLMTKFKAMVDSGKLKVEIRNGLMLVKLADNILFDPGKTDLKPAGKEAIKEVSQVLADIANRKFQVAGHTDNVALKGGKFKDNWQLSTARAVEVLHFMIKEGKMPADRVSAAGFADQLPVADNKDEEGRKQNRRIEIVLMPNMDDLPPMQDIK